MHTIFKRISLGSVTNGKDIMVATTVWLYNVIKVECIGTLLLRYMKERTNNDRAISWGRHQKMLRNSPQKKKNYRHVLQGLFRKQEVIAHQVGMETTTFKNNRLSSGNLT